MKNTKKVLSGVMAFAMLTSFAANVGAVSHDASTHTTKHYVSIDEDNHKIYCGTATCVNHINGENGTANSGTALTDNEGHTKAYDASRSDLNTATEHATKCTAGDCNWVGTASHDWDTSGKYNADNKRTGYTSTWERFDDNGTIKYKVNIDLKCSGGCGATKRVRKTIDSPTDTATCTEAGVATWKAAIAENDEVEGVTFTAAGEIPDNLIASPAKGHNYTSKFVWGEDNSTCNVVFSCANCAEGTEGNTVTVPATVTHVDSETTSCTDPLERVWTAKVKHPVTGADVTETKPETITGTHTWGKPTWGTVSDTNKAGQAPANWKSCITETKARCTVCGTEGKTGESPALVIENVPNSADTKPATCVEDGLKKVTLRIKGTDWTLPLTYTTPAEGHDWTKAGGGSGWEFHWTGGTNGEVQTVTCDRTCGRPECGEKQTATCSVDHNDDDKKCTADWTRTYEVTATYDGVVVKKDTTHTQTVLADKSHTPDKGTVGTPATCVTGGTMDHTCVVCSSTFHLPIPATGHSLVAVPAKEPTCTTEGNKAYYKCVNKGCTDIFSDNKEEPTVIGDPNTVVIDALGHDWEEVEGGQKCKVCGKLKGGSQNIQATTDAATKELAPKINKDEIETAIMTEEDKAVVEAGGSVEVSMNIKSKKATTGETNFVKSVLKKDESVGQFFDLSITKTVVADGDETVTNITELDSKVKVTITIPTDLKKEGRTYKVARIHDYVAEVLTTKDNEDGTVTFETDSFSPYAIICVDAASSEEDAVEEFVDRLYKKILGRTDDGISATEKQGWIDAIKSGETTAAEIAGGFLHSGEFALRATTDEQYIDVLYQAFCDRPAGTEGNVWVDVIKTYSRDKAFAGLVGSPEFIGYADSVGIPVGEVTLTEARDTVSDNVHKFVVQMYKNALGVTTPDAAGLNNHCKIAATDPAADAKNFVFAPQFAEKYNTNEKFVNQLYLVLFGREADAAGAASWVAAMADGATREDVFNGFIGSVECAAYFATFAD